MAARSRFKRRRELTERQISELVKWLVKQAIHGAGPFASAAALADEYAQKYSDPEQAINSLVRTEMLKIGTSGFIMGLPGLVALPIVLPATLGADYLIAARLVAAVAHLRGWNLQSNTVQTCVILCLMGNHGKELVKQTSRVAGVRAARGIVQALSARALSSIHRSVGARIASHLWERGALTLTRAAPLVGGLIGGGIDAAFLGVCAHAAKTVFKPNHPGLMTGAAENPHDFFDLSK